MKFTPNAAVVFAHCNKFVHNQMHWLCSYFFSDGQMSNASVCPGDELPEIKHGEPITDRRSTFQPHLAMVVTPKQVCEPFQPI